MGGPAVVFFLPPSAPLVNLEGAQAYGRRARHMLTVKHAVNRPVMKRSIAQGAHLYRTD